MNKEIFNLISEILLCFIIIIGTIFIFPNFEKNFQKEKQKIEILNKNLSIKLINNEEKWFPMTDEYAVNNLISNEIKISNYGKNSSQYSLYLKINKDSSIRDNELKIIFNNKIYNLEELYEYTYLEYNYYNLYNSNIIDYELLEYNIYLKDSATMIDNNLLYSFEII